jgi:hypothetical protein
VLSPPLEGEGVEEAVTARLATEEVAVRAIDGEVVNDDEADAVVFGFCWVTVRLARIKYPWLLLQHGRAAPPVPAQ